MRQLQKSAISLILTLLACAICAGPSFAISDQEKQLYAASENTPTSFLSPTQYRSDIMDKATNLITDWGPFDSYKTVMRVSNSTPSLIETYDPDAIDRIGFKVECTNHGGGQDQVDVSCIAYVGNIFTAAREYKDAVKRARMLSYLLQVYAVSLIKADQAAAPPAAQQQPQAAPSQNDEMVGAIPPDLRLYLELIATQIASKSYDSALSTIDALRDNVTKAKAQSASVAADPSTTPPQLQESTTPEVPEAAPQASQPAASASAKSPVPVPKKMIFKMMDGEVVTGTVASHDLKQKVTNVITSNGPRALNDAGIYSEAPAPAQ